MFRNFSDRNGFLMGRNRFQWILMDCNGFLTECNGFQWIVNRWWKSNVSGQQDVGMTNDPNVKFRNTICFPK